MTAAIGTTNHGESVRAATQTRPAVTHPAALSRQVARKRTARTASSSLLVAAMTTFTAKLSTSAAVREAAPALTAIRAGVAVSAPPRLWNTSDATATSQVQSARLNA